MSEKLEMESVSQNNKHELLQHFSSLAWFREWPNPSVPAVAGGVYVVWSGEQLIYAGMSGRSIEKQQHRKKYGLVTRLESHAKGRLSGDQFNVYVANRFVVPSLTAEQQSQMSTGLLTLDVLTRQFIHQYFQYQYLIVDHSKEAFAIERLCQAGYIFNQKPYLNPIAPSPSVSDRQILQAFLDQKLC